MSTKSRKRRTTEQIVKKLRDADAMLNASKDPGPARINRQVRRSGAFIVGVVHLR